MMLLSFQDGASPGEQTIQVDIVGADAFDAAYSSAGTAPVQIAPAVDDSLPDILLPPPLSDLDLISVPDPAPAPDPVEILKRETVIADPVASALPQEIKAPQEPLRMEAPKPSPRLTRKAASKPPHPSPQGLRETGQGNDAVSSSASTRGSQGQSGTVGAGAYASFSSSVKAHLMRFKRYPEAARIQNLHGRAAVTFSLDAGGNVTGVSLSGSSGSGLLDAEALATVRRASPFPPIPPETGRTSASFTDGLVYNLAD